MNRSTSSPTELCLGVAVDHRIRSLFKPIRIQTQVRMQGDDSHAQLLKNLARGRTDRYISKDEIDMTLELSGPQTVGGITVVLQQPARFHPYSKGLEAVLDYSATLSTIDKAFSAVSCGTISIRSSTLSLIDSLPYVGPDDDISSEEKKRVRRVTSHVIIRKDPDVVLCMWRQAENGEITLAMSKFRSLGVGRDFDRPTITLRPGSVAERVNSFHPSFAINYNPYDSCFRQLLLLNVAKACRVYEGTWSEEEWMNDLKKRCRDEARAGINLCKADLKYCGSHLNSQLDQIREWTVHLVVGNQSSQTKDMYNDPLGERLSERFNDASLCLRERYQDTAISPDDITPENRMEISTGGMQCYKLLTGIICAIRGHRRISNGTSCGVYDPDSLKGLINSLTVPRSPAHRNLWTILGRFLENLNLSFTKADRGKAYTFSFKDISDLFLSVAADVENMLQDLLRNGDGQAVEIQGLEDRMAGMRM
ncbi:hypothetical protein BDV24DRAFT_158889 [Aspergillus arachidicola]|uniref:Uncharacterized protein n=1 Tax=Aspergillus arachidicola TaxID=656916 RepID=A0A5N6YKN8_9EURO|nr:hypothetical protein BDV24DRAFT_158889 [Aspergillus arachidicola]